MTSPEGVVTAVQWETGSPSASVMISECDCSAFPLLSGLFPMRGRSGQATPVRTIPLHTWKAQSGFRDVMPQNHLECIVLRHAAMPRQLLAI